MNSTVDCSSEGSPYDLPLHIGSVFIIFGVSFMGVMIPLISSHYKESKFIRKFISCAKLFGTGIILATSLVHMILPAAQMFQSPCLPQVWQNFSPWVAVFVFAGLLSTHLLQLAISQQLSKSDPNKPLLTNHSDEESGSTTVNHLAGPLTCSDSISDSDSNIQSHHCDHHVHGFLYLNEKTLAVLLLEVGIIAHSLIIGIGMGVLAKGFVSLLIAISFHQFFEGLALSSMVTDSELSEKAKLLLGVVIYSCSTPIGIAIGIGINSTYNDNSVTALLVQGILEAFAGGILIFDVLVNILAPHCKTVEFLSQSFGSQALEIACLWLGTGIMTYIGEYA